MTALAEARAAVLDAAERGLEHARLERRLRARLRRHTLRLRAPNARRRRGWRVVDSYSLAGLGEFANLEAVEAWLTSREGSR